MVLKNIKKTLLIAFLIGLGSCKNPEPNDLLPDTQVDITIDLSNPEFIDLKVPAGWAYASGGIKGILLYNKNSTFLAFDRACPHLSLTKCTPMVFDGALLKCTCDNSTFNILQGGAPQTAGVNYSAREYHVQVVSATVLKITNY